MEYKSQQRFGRFEISIPKVYSDEMLAQKSLAYRICHDVTGSWSERSLLELNGAEAERVYQEQREAAEFEQMKRDNLNGDNTLIWHNRIAFDIPAIAANIATNSAEIKKGIDARLQEVQRRNQRGSELARNSVTSRSK